MWVECGFKFIERTREKLYTVLSAIRKVTFKRCTFIRIQLWLGKGFFYTTFIFYYLFLCLLFWCVLSLRSSCFLRSLLSLLFFFNCCCRDTPIFGLHFAPPPPSDLPHSYSAPCIVIFFFCRLICSAWATCLSMILAHYYNVYNAWLPENFIMVHLCWNNIPWLWIYFSLKFNILVVHKIFCYVFSC